MGDIHLVSRPAAGGIKTHLSGLITDLPLFGWTAHLHAPTALIEELPPCDSYGLEIPARLSVQDLGVALRLIRQLPPDCLVHAHGIRAAWICSLASMLSPIKFVTTLHNIPPQGFVSKTALAFIGARTKKFICVSNEIAHTFSSGSTVVIPNGVEVEIQFPITREEQRKVLGFPNGQFLVCTAARLSREKGIDQLLSAAKQLPNIRFVIAGDGPLAAELQADAPNNVTFLGQRNDVSALLYASDCVAFPSRSEGQGIGVLEAFEAGTPVIGTNVGGIPESIVDGKTGLLIAPEDINALIAAILAVQSNPEEFRDIARNAQRWVRANRKRQEQSRLVGEVYDVIDAGS